MTTNLSWTDIQQGCDTIVQGLKQDNWKPNYIVGLSRGGLIPAVMISHATMVPVVPLTVTLRDHSITESNILFAKDAFGAVYDSTGELVFSQAKKNILIVDDINDSGATLSWIKDDWRQLSNDIETPDESIWHCNVRIAVLVNNTHSKETIDYYHFNIDKQKDNSWIVFPWEDWWKT